MLSADHCSALPGYLAYVIIETEPVIISIESLGRPFIPLPLSASVCVRHAHSTRIAIFCGMSSIWMLARKARQQALKMGCIFDGPTNISTQMTRGKKQASSPLQFLQILSPLPASWVGAWAKKAHGLCAPPRLLRCTRCGAAQRAAIGGKQTRTSPPTPPTELLFGINANRGHDTITQPLGSE